MVLMVTAVKTSQVFTIDLNPFPPADNVISRTECLPYSIATPINGTVYTAPGGPTGGGTVCFFITSF